MRGLTKTEEDALRAVAAAHGFTATRGPLTKGGAVAGNAVKLLLSIISGETATVLLDPDDRQDLIAWLAQQETGSTLRDAALQALVGQLRDAAARAES